MSSQEITNLITALANQTEESSITPTSLADILQALLDFAAKSSGGFSACNYFFGTLCNVTTTAGTEVELTNYDGDSASVTGNIIRLNDSDATEPFLTAQVDCLVEMTGYITLKCVDTYSSDRVINIYVVDADAEKVYRQVNTVHFTGTTQIFSVPIAYSARLAAGDILHLTHYSSAGTSLISAQSWINLKATPL